LSCYLYLFTPPYSVEIGKKYTLLQDCYIYKYTDVDKLFVANHSVNDRLPERVDIHFIGIRSDHIKIVGIFHRGDIFEVRKCFKESSVDNLSFNYEAKFGESLSGHMLYDVSFLTDFKLNPPRFEPEQVKEIVVVR